MQKGLVTSESCFAVVVVSKPRPIFLNEFIGRLPMIETISSSSRRPRPFRCPEINQDKICLNYCARSFSGNIKQIA